MRRLALLTFGLTTSLLQATDPALLNLVMPDAKVLAGINVQKAKTTDFGQFLLNMVPVDDNMKGFIAATGFDPRQDIDEVLMATDGAPKASGLVLARGKFDPVKISAAVAADGKHASQTYKGVQLITANSAKDNGAVAFLSPTIAIVGNLATVKAAVDRSTGTNALDPALMAKINSYSAADAWSISTGSIQFGQPSDTAGNPMAGALKSIQQASGSILLASPVQINVEAEADTDQNASSLADILKFVVMMMPAKPGSTLANDLQVSTDHTTIKVSLAIPEADLEQLIKGAGVPKQTIQ